MLKFLETKSTTISQDTFTNKFKGKKVLVIGSGPSVNLVNWKNITYDCVVTTTFFYLNEEIRNLNNITHITLSEIIDFDDKNLHEFLEKNPNCTIALEPKNGRPFYTSATYSIFEERYRERLLYYNTEVDRKEGAAGRLCFFTMAFNPSELYYVGIDGKSTTPGNDPKNVFRTHIQGDADGYDYKEFLDSHTTMADTLYRYSLQNECKLYNLGEGFDFNCSTFYSKQHFPLSSEIKTLINK
jgi:hypothetical protein